MTSPDRIAENTDAPDTEFLRAPVLVRGLAVVWDEETDLGAGWVRGCAVTAAPEAALELDACGA